MADSDRSSADRFDCPSCGAPLQAGLADQFFCEYCGAPLPGTSSGRRTAGPPLTEAESAGLREARPPAPTNLPMPEVVPARSRPCLVYGTVLLVLVVLACAVVWISLPALSSRVGNLLESRGRQETVTVSAGEGWQSTGLRFRPGQRVTIAFLGGTWSVWGGPKQQADGTGHLGEYRDNVPLPSVPVGALIGRIEEGQAFYVGNELDFVSQEKGTLWLRINDLWLSDNTGALVVQVGTRFGPDSSSLSITSSDGSAAGNLIVNGGFVGLEGWKVQPSQNCTRCSMETRLGDVQGGHYLAWERTRSGADGGALWARQWPNYDVRDCRKLLLSFDVRVDHHSLSNSGWWSDTRGGSGEYPAKVVVAFTDAQGERFGWSHGFLSHHDGSTRLVNYTLVPPGEWVHFEADLFARKNWVDEGGEPLPSPVALADIFVGGNGWDFAGALTNLRLSCP